MLVGVPAHEREAVGARVAALGLSDLVTVRPWLNRAEFQRCFTSAALVVFPSDHEGFGLPAVEAMRLGIPLVITPDKALLETTGGLATVAATGLRHHSPEPSLRDCGRRQKSSSGVCSMPEFHVATHGRRPALSPRGLRGRRIVSPGPG